MDTLPSPRSPLPPKPCPDSLFPLPSRDYVLTSSPRARPSVAPDPIPPTAPITPPSPCSPSPSTLSPAPLPFPSPRHQCKLSGSTPKIRTRRAHSLGTAPYGRSAHGTVRGSWSATQLVEALHQLAHFEVKLTRILGSGLHRQAKFRWRGGMISVNIWQTGRVHIQGRGSGDLARRLSTFPRSPFCGSSSSAASASIGRKNSSFNIAEPNTVSLMAPGVAFGSLCGFGGLSIPTFWVFCLLLFMRAQLLPFPLLETSSWPPERSNRHKRRKLIRGTGSQAALIFHIPFHTPLEPLLCVYSISHLVAGCCHVPSPVWLPCVRLGGSSWLAWTSPPSCFGDFPCGLLNIFSLVCACTPVSSSAACWSLVMRGACVCCRIPLVPGSFTHSHQPGWHNLEDRAG